MMVAYKTYGFDTILNQRNQCPYTGKEIALRAYNPSIKIFADEFGSKRFVLYLHGRAVSGLQLMIEGCTARVANVITVKQHRRKGYARQLWVEAKRHHPIIHHSTNLSEDGKIFSQHCN